MDRAAADQAAVISEEEMSSKSKIMRIFTLPQQFPCGPESSCCGPVGQSEEELQNLKAAIEKEFGLPVNIYDSTNGKIMRDHMQTLRLVRSLGPMTLPIITIDDDIVSIGNLTPEKAITAIKDKLSQA